MVNTVTREGRGMKRLLIALAMLSGCTTPENKTIETLDAGEFLESNLMEKDWTDNGYTTTIKTTKGTFYVFGKYSAIKDSKMTIEIKENGEQYLCNEYKQKCYYIR